MKQNEGTKSHSNQIAVNQTTKSHWQFTTLPYSSAIVELSSK